MLIDKHPAEDVLARVPEVATQTDPVLKQLDRLLDDDELSRQVRADMGKCSRFTLVQGRHATPVEVRLAHADLQTSVSVELSRNGRTGQG
jgi:IS5 family transposase